MLERLMPVSRVKVLRLLLCVGSPDLYLREVARLAGVHLQAAQRELALLEEIGLVARTTRGRHVFFAVRRDHPLGAGLAALLAADPATDAPSPAPRPPVGADDGRTPATTDPPDRPPAVPAVEPEKDDWHVW